LFDAHTFLFGKNLKTAGPSRDDEERRRIISEQDAALKRAIEEDEARQRKREEERLAAERQEVEVCLGGRPLFHSHFFGLFSKKHKINSRP